MSVQKQLANTLETREEIQITTSHQSVKGGWNQSPTKKVRLASLTVDDELSQRQNLELLASTEERSMACNTFSNLVKHTFPMRRKFQVSHDHRSYERNLSNCVEKPEKVRTSTGFEPVTSRYRCNALTN